mmetsp:Transcript_35393/g.114017  ORF Transcript_35393/g.114017 Transcript_35393/m.114017 type:complete len:236 (-) Transcript_35393:195-902(-)
MRLRARGRQHPQVQAAALALPRIRRASRRLTALLRARAHHRVDAGATRRQGGGAGGALARRARSDRREAFVAHAVRALLVPVHADGPQLVQLPLRPSHPHPLPHRLRGVPILRPRLLRRLSPDGSRLCRRRQSRHPPPLARPRVFDRARRAGHAGRAGQCGRAGRLALQRGTAAVRLQPAGHFSPDRGRCADDDPGAPDTAAQGDLLAAPAAQRLLPACLSGGGAHPGTGDSARL